MMMMKAVVFSLLIALAIGNKPTTTSTTTTTTTPTTTSTTATTTTPTTPTNIPGSPDETRTKERRSAAEEDRIDSTTLKELIQQVLKELLAKEQVSAPAPVYYPSPFIPAHGIPGYPIPGTGVPATPAYPTGSPSYAYPAYPQPGSAMPALPAGYGR